MRVEIYIKSITYTLDERHQAHQTRLAACGQFRTHIPMGGWEGRLLDPESAQIIQSINRLPAAVTRSLRIIDVSTLRGRIKAWRSGVHGAPVVVIDGCRFNGAKQAVNALAGLAARGDTQQLGMSSEH